MITSFLKKCHNALQSKLEQADARRGLRLLHIFTVIYKEPTAAPAKVFFKIRSVIQDKLQARRDRLRPSYLLAPMHGKPRNLFMFPPAHSVREHVQAYRVLAQKTMNHEFDLLGSGWVKLDRGLERAGVEVGNGGGRYEPSEPECPKVNIEILLRQISENNRPKARSLWEKVSKDYTPISWNEDFKSGFVWPATIPSTSQKYGNDPGADIKVPWELARMHQLTWLAFAAGLAKAGEGGFENPEIYLREYQDQVLDFAAACPPRFGANWVCAMDVAIRACNMLAAHDVFISLGFIFPDAFEKELLRIANDHFEHISTHMEYQPVVRANHYYSDVVGLLILCAWLPPTPRTVAALAWAINEFFIETQLQFHKDGSNFEASTSYHRLCGELLLYALAVVQGLDIHTLHVLNKADLSQWSGYGYYPVPPLKTVPEQDKNGIIIPREVLERAAKLVDFSLACRMEEKEIVQVGDNDSGRLFKFLPSLFGEDYLEAVNDHSHLLGAAYGLTSDPRLSLWRNHPDAHQVAHLAPKTIEPVFLQNAKNPVGALTAFPDFGLFFYTVKDDVIAIRCGHNGQYDNGGHAHNDQLSLSFARRGTMFLVDPGTYLYTPVPAWRNQFRKTCRHNTVFLPDEEQNDFSPTSLFTLTNKARPEILEANEHSFRARHYGFSAAHERRLSFTDHFIEVRDAVACDSARIFLCLHPGVRLLECNGPVCLLERNGITVTLSFTENSSAHWEPGSFFYSSAYGRKCPTICLTSSAFAQELTWRIF